MDRAVVAFIARPADVRPGRFDVLFNQQTGELTSALAAKDAGSLLANHL